MADLIVVGFQGTHRAAEVLEQLQRLHAEIALDLQDAVAVYRSRNGKLRVDQSMHLTTGEETVWGGVLGAFVGALLVLPAAALAGVPAAAAALGIGGATIGATGGAVMAFDEVTTWRDTFGISDEFVKEVGGMVQPGHSAVFALLRASDPATVAERFRGHGGKVLRTTLPPEQARKVEETLALQRETVIR
jgi:uncharacterized membrane protein